MKKAKKLIIALAMTLGCSTLGFSQLNGEQNRAISLARNAAADCYSKPDYAGLQINYSLTETSICDFLAGPTGSAAIFGYQVDVYAVGHCPGNVRELCDPIFIHVATVQVSCGNAEVTEVTCY